MIVRLFLVVCTVLLLSISAAAENQLVYKVINVSQNDPEGLNVRSNVIEAGSLKETTVIGNLAWNETDILASGLEVEIAGKIWRHVRHGSVESWVNAKYLAADRDAKPVEISPRRLKCSGTEPFWGLVIPAPAGRVMNGSQKHLCR